MARPFADKMNDLQRLLDEGEGRFGNYQTFPDSVLKAVPELSNIGYRQEQIRLDQSRLAWLREQYEKSDFTLIEIGANLGYFSITLAAENGAQVIAFEPMESYSEACRIMADLCNIGDRVDARPTGLSLADLNGIPSTDLIINLNVLHHAGFVFDQEKTEQMGGWKIYAQAYLSKLAEKGHYLFLQTGNKSHGPAVFGSEEAVPFMFDLLEESGWEVQALGVIDDFDKLMYTTYPREKVLQAPVTSCRRNPESGLVDYTRNGLVVACLPKGLAQRPLWFCKSKGTP